MDSAENENVPKCVHNTHYILHIVQITSKTYHLHPLNSSCMLAKKYLAVEIKVNDVIGTEYLRFSFSEYGFLVIKWGRTSVGLIRVTSQSRTDCVFNSKS